MPIVEAKVSSDLKAAITQELKSALTTKDSPSDIAASHAKLAEAIARAVAKVICSLLLKDTQVAAGIAVATAGSPAAQTGATTAPGKLV